MKHSSHTTSSDVIPFPLGTVSVNLVRFAMWGFYYAVKNYIFAPTLTL